MLNLKSSTWQKSVPSNILQYCFTPAPYSLRFVNFLFQKVFRLNASQSFMVHFTSVISGKVEIGREVSRYMAGSPGCYIQGINGVRIGDNTMIAPGVKIISANHMQGEHFKHVLTDAIDIGRNCWIGTNAVILPGVQLGDNSIVGAGAVLTKSFPENSIVVGNPAKLIRMNN